ncbi:zinc ribbon domain-containing protein [Lysinimonas soli]|uniref:Zinc ribbon domain-containing protein n=1 Tax=Lysinimonas soli TaxID=1074233 RepID=A0ABW0NRF7_9MICO
MALKAAPEDQALLLELQALDTKLQQLGHRAANLPELAVIATLAGERDALRVTVGEQSGASEDAQTELKRTEADVAVVEARVARDRERLQGSASVKDVAALEQELAALARRQSDLEDIQLAVMETVEERASVLAGSRALLAAVEAKIVEAAGARDAALAELDDERQRAVSDREAIAAKVPADLLALYEKQRARYGIGASLLRGGVSSASGVALNSSDMTVVRAAAPDDVLLCPDSSAILVRTAESGL